jgi:hypothetical protein
MNQPTRGDGTNPGQSTEKHDHANQGLSPGSETCARCQALEARIAELEAESARYRGAEPAAATPSTHALPLLEFKALRLFPHGWAEGWGLRPSPPRRQWMNELPYAYQCLPLVMANQWGWQILCPTDVRVTWDGTPGLSGLRVEAKPQYQPSIKSQFGAGIVTFSPPWLFRTPPGWDLYSKGPSNRWKPNCVPLEGVIETWWLNYTFTLNWKLVEPGTVVFAEGESLGQLVPVPHSTFQNATAIEAPIGLIEPRAAQELVQWLERRRSMVYQNVRTHHLYRKAEGVEEHLQRVPVPPIEAIPPWDRPARNDPADGPGPGG